MKNIETLAKISFYFIFLIIAFVILQFNGLFNLFLGWDLPLASEWIMFFIGIIFLLVIPKIYLKVKNSEKTFHNETDHTGRYLCWVFFFFGITFIIMFIIMIAGE